MLTAREITVRLAALEARKYHLECVTVYDMTDDDYRQWRATYEALTEEIMDLECRQDELIKAGVYHQGDDERYTCTGAADCGCIGCEKEAM